MKTTANQDQVGSQTTDQSYEGIVVLGVPRSGTTLVRRLLDAHPNICCPPETNLLRAASRFLDEEPSAAGFPVGVLPGLAFSDIGERDVTLRLREFVFSFHRELAARSRKSRWAEKTAFDIFHIDNLERLLKNSCRFVCVFRHGLDAVCSMKELCDGMDRYLIELHDYIRAHASPHEAFAHAWVDCNQRLLQFMADHPDLCVSLRYEDLLDDAAAHMTRVFEFLGEPTDVPRLIESAFDQTVAVGLGDWKTYETNQLDRGSVDRWHGLRDETVARLAEIVNPTLQALGYESVAAGDPADVQEKVQHYRASLMVQQLMGRQHAANPPDSPTAPAG